MDRKHTMFRILIILALLNISSSWVGFKNVKKVLIQGLLAPLILSTAIQPAFAADQRVYFGVGCYWHVSIPN